MDKYRSVALICLMTVTDFQFFSPNDSSLVRSCALRANFQTAACNAGAALTLCHGWLFLGGSGSVWKQCQGHGSHLRRNWAERGRPWQRHPPPEEDRRDQSQTQVHLRYRLPMKVNRSNLGLQLSAKFHFQLKFSFFMTTDVCRCLLKELYSQ